MQDAGYKINPPSSPFSKGGDIFPSLAKRGEGRFYKTMFSNESSYESCIMNRVD
jgi:hypothetical protein